VGTAGIAAVTSMVLAFVLLTSWVDRRFAAVAGIAKHAFGTSTRTRWKASRSKFPELARRNVDHRDPTRSAKWSALRAASRLTFTCMRLYALR